MGLKTSALGEHQRHVLAPIEPLTSTSTVIGRSGRAPEFRRPSIKITLYRMIVRCGVAGGARSSAAFSCIALDIHHGR